MEIVPTITIIHDFEQTSLLPDDSRVWKPDSIKPPNPIPTWSPDPDCGIPSPILHSLTFFLLFLRCLLNLLQISRSDPFLNFVNLILDVFNLWSGDCNLLSHHLINLLQILNFLLYLFMSFRLICLNPFGIDFLLLLQFGETVTQPVSTPTLDTRQFTNFRLEIPCRFDIPLQPCRFLLLHLLQLLYFCLQLLIFIKGFLQHQCCRVYRFCLTLPIVLQYSILQCLILICQFSHLPSQLIQLFLLQFQCLFALGDGLQLIWCRLWFLYVF